MSIHRIKVLSAAILFTTASSIPTLALAGYCSPDKTKSKQPAPEFKQHQVQQRTAPRYAHPYARTYTHTYNGYNQYRQSRQQPVNYAYPGYYAKRFYQARPAYPPRMKQAWQQQRPPQKMNPYAAPKSSVKPQQKAYNPWKAQQPKQRYINYNRPPQHQRQVQAPHPGYNRAYSANNRAAYYYPNYPAQVNRGYQQPVQQYRPKQAPAPTRYYNWSYSQYQPQANNWSAQPAGQRQYNAYAKPKKIKFDQPKQKPAWQQISITEQGFQPAQLRVKPGDRVFWANMDIEPHQISSATGWKSKTLGRGATYAHTFKKPGIYKYYSAANPRWVGKVLVE